MLDHLLIKILVIPVIPLFHLALLIKISRKNVRIFVNAAILNRAICFASDLLMSRKPIIEKENL